MILKIIFVLVFPFLFVSCSDRGSLTICTISRGEADIDSLSTALKVFRLRIGRYPTEEEGLQALVTRPVSLDAAPKWVQLMEKVPLDSWDRPYRYRIPGQHNPDSYDVFSLGKDGIENQDDIGNWKTN
jgi:general secretion pathway protein G